MVDPTKLFNNLTTLRSYAAESLLGPALKRRGVTSLPIFLVCREDSALQLFEISPRIFDGCPEADPR